MFSRLYKSAKAILIDSAESEKTQPTPIVEPPPDETMVTTRQKDTQNADHQIEEEDSINVYVLSSSSKRQRKGAKGKSSSEEDEAEYVPPSSRKRKRLPVRAKDSPDIGKTRPVVEIPVKKISPEPNNGNTSASDEEEEEEQQGTKARDEEHAAASAKSVEKSKHRRFGSEPAEDEFFSTAGEVVNDTGRSTFEVGEDSGVIEDSEDSEDEAPEAVGIHEAAEHVKSKDREAARVVQDQLSASRKKRKEKDDALKKQAESNKKRKLEDDITIDTKKIKQSASEEPPSTNAGQGLDDEESHAVPKKIGIHRDTFKRLSLSSKRALPDVLPAEYLEDTEPQDHLPFDHFPIKKAKKTKFHLTAGKEPKDRRAGSTTYRVTKASSLNLAPKSSSQARNTKESWFQGRSGKKGVTNRTPFTKGFFKK